MFKTLSRIVELLTEIRDTNVNAFAYCKERDARLELKQDLWFAAQQRTQWKCLKANCSIEPYHVHVIVDPTSTSTGEQT